MAKLFSKFSLFRHLNETSTNNRKQNVMRNKLLMYCMIFLSFVALSACSSYYKVTDPTTGKSYYADDIDEDDGSITFDDPNTGSTVTLQNSEVIKVNEEEYKAHTRKD